MHPNRYRSGKCNSNAIFVLEKNILLYKHLLVFVLDITNKRQMISLFLIIVTKFCVYVCVCVTNNDILNQVNNHSERDK